MPSTVLLGLPCKKHAVQCGSVGTQVETDLFQAGLVWFSAMLANMSLNYYSGTIFLQLVVIVDQHYMLVFCGCFYVVPVKAF